MAACAMQPHIAKLAKKFKIRVVDWRREVLEYVLEDVVFAIETFLRFFDLKAMQGASKLRDANYQVGIQNT